MVDQVPDYETARSLTFKVYARDDPGRLSDAESITISINDVNEPPVLDAAMLPANMIPPDQSGRQNGDNMVCTALFMLFEFRKDGTAVISGQSNPALVDGAQGVDSNGRRRQPRATERCRQPWKHRKLCGQGRQPSWVLARRLQGHAATSEEE